MLQKDQKVVYLCKKLFRQRENSVAVAQLTGNQAFTCGNFISQLLRPLLAPKSGAELSPKVLRGQHTENT